MVELGNFASEDMTVALGFSYLLGAIAAGFVGLLCIRRMISWVRRKNFGSLRIIVFSPASLP